MRIGFYKIFSIAALILSTACTSAKKIDSSTSGSENNLNLATSPDKKTDLDKVETKTETDSQTSNVQIDEYHRSLPNQYNHCENWKFSEELFKEKDAAKAMTEEQVLLCLYQNLEDMDFITTIMHGKG